MTLTPGMGMRGGQIITKNHKNLKNKTRIERGPREVAERGVGDVLNPWPKYPGQPRRGERRLHGNHDVAPRDQRLECPG